MPLVFQMSSRNKADPVLSIKLHRYAYKLSLYSIMRQDLKTVTDSVHEDLDNLQSSMDCNTLKSLLKTL